MWCLCATLFQRYSPPLIKLKLSSLSLIVIVIVKRPSSSSVPQRTFWEALSVSNHTS